MMKCKRLDGSCSNAACRRGRQAWIEKTKKFIVLAPKPKHSVKQPVAAMAEANPAAELSPGAEPESAADSFGSQGDPGCLVNFFKFVGTCGDDADGCGVCALASGLAAHYHEVVMEVGEPEALRIYGGISGNLQRLPPSATFSPLDLYIAAMFYIAFYDGPAAVRSAGHQPEDVRRCAHEIFKRMDAYGDLIVTTRQRSSQSR